MNDMQRVAVFWTHPGVHGWICDELKQGRLRQGWGCSGTNLKDAGVPVAFKDWLAPYSAGASTAWRADVSTFEWEKNAKTRHDILCRMLQFKRGDLVVVPRIFFDNEFTICRVTTGYRWDDSHFGRINFPEGSSMDCAHIVGVDPDNMVTIKQSESLAAQLVAEKFRTYRSAVNLVRDPKLAKIIADLYSQESSASPY